MQWLNPLFSWCLLPIHYLLSTLLPAVHMGMLDGNLHSCYEQIFLSHLWLLPSLHFFLRHTHTCTVFIRKSSNCPARWQLGIFWAVASVLVGRSSSTNSGQGTEPVLFLLDLPVAVKGILSFSSSVCGLPDSSQLSFSTLDSGGGWGLWTGVLGWGSRKAHSVFGLN